MSDDNVIELDIVTTNKADPDKVLAKASGELETVVLIGFTKEDEFYFASSQPDSAEVTWLLQRAQYLLMRIQDDLEGE